MAAEKPITREHGNAYNIFILLLTLGSLAIMVLLLLPLDQQVINLLDAYMNIICVIFLADFAYNLSGSRPRTEYFIHQRGWLDLIGSIPSFGISRYAGLLRLARLSRLARIARLMGGKNRTALVEDVVKNRGQYAVFITLLSAGFVIVTSSILMIYFESHAEGANITTGGDAIWWALVTITTVGYGDKYPITPLGRSTAVMVMFAGVGIIGALASILASLLVPPPKTATSEAPAVEPTEAGPAVPAPAPDVAHELALLRAELAELREAVTARPAPPG